MEDRSYRQWLFSKNCHTRRRPFRKPAKPGFPDPAGVGRWDKNAAPSSPNLRDTQTKQRLCPSGSAAANGDMVFSSDAVKAPAKPFLNERLTPLL
jgi:hypothetical protein